MAGVTMPVASSRIFHPAVAGVEPPGAMDSSDGLRGRDEDAANVRHMERLRLALVLGRARVLSVVSYATKKSKIKGAYGGMSMGNGGGSRILSHSCTVERLPFLEVKMEEHDKVGLLRKKEVKGVDYLKMEKNKLEIESLESKKLVAAQSIIRSRNPSYSFSFLSWLPDVRREANYRFD
ncbi:hypothetical protein EJB05_22484, partial [Eragrostis curvula]